MLTRPALRYLRVSGRILWHVLSRCLLSRIHVASAILHAAHPRKLHALLHLTTRLAEMGCWRLRWMRRLRLCRIALIIMLRRLWLVPHLTRLVVVVGSALTNAAR